MTSDPQGRVRGRQWNPDEWPLGEHSDRRVALMAGVSTSHARSERIKRGISLPAKRWHPERWPVGWVSDGVIAKHAGVPRSVVAHVRRRLGIPPLTKARREQLGARCEAALLRWCLDAEETLTPLAVFLFALDVGLWWPRIDGGE